MKINQIDRGGCGYLVFAVLVDSAVGALHGVAADDSDLSPHYHTCCGFLCFLHHEATVLPGEDWGSQVEDPRQCLKIEYRRMIKGEVRWRIGGIV